MKSTNPIRMRQKTANTSLNNSRAVSKRINNYVEDNTNMFRTSANYSTILNTDGFVRISDIQK